MSAIAYVIRWVDKGNPTSAFCLTFIPCLRSQQIAQARTSRIERTDNPITTYAENRRRHLLEWAN